MLTLAIFLFSGWLILKAQKYPVQNCVQWLNSIVYPTPGIVVRNIVAVEFVLKLLHSMLHHNYIQALTCNK